MNFRWCGLDAWGTAASIGLYRLAPLSPVESNSIKYDPICFTLRPSLGDINVSPTLQCGLATRSQLLCRKSCREISIKKNLQ
ncbi:hypothetical protein J6590_027584 [Homalodisca vitripennis]|nr:hypothetical protein J6590_027584 [Homalodisca vitripennis]